MEERGGRVVATFREPPTSRGVSLSTRRETELQLRNIVDLVENAVGADIEQYVRLRARWAIGGCSEDKVGLGELSERDRGYGAQRG